MNLVNVVVGIDNSPRPEEANLAFPIPTIERPKPKRHKHYCLRLEISIMITLILFDARKVIVNRSIARFANLKGTNIIVYIL